MPRERENETIEGLSQKLAALKQKKSELDAEANEWVEKRNKLNEQVKNLRNEIILFHTERDSLNGKVRELKQQRNDFRTRILGTIDEMKKLTEDNRILAKRKPSKSHRALQNEIEDIEWKIQTTSLTLQEDKEHVEKVKQLETQLNVHKKLEKSVQRIFELRAEVKTLKTESQLCHETLTKNAQKSQQLHENMLEKTVELRKRKAEADGLHRRFLEEKEKTRPLQEEMERVSAQLSQLKATIQAQEQEEKKKNEDAVRETLEKQAREKMKRGEKLSWEEFQLLAEKGMATQD